MGCRHTEIYDHILYTVRIMMMEEVGRYHWYFIRQHTTGNIEHSDQNRKFFKPERIYMFEHKNVFANQN